MRIRGVNNKTDDKEYKLIWTYKIKFKIQVIKRYKDMNNKKLIIMTEQKKIY